MPTLANRAALFTFVSAFMWVGCGGGATRPDGGTGTGGAASGTGGTPGTGGTQATGGTIGTGGAHAATGGTTAATGGMVGDGGSPQTGGQGGGVAGGGGKGGAVGGHGGQAGQAGQGGGHGGNAGQGGNTGCASAVENGTCGSEGMTCSSGCTDACQFCNLFRCQGGRWIRMESAPAPCFMCGPTLRCQKNAQYCSITMGGPVGASPLYQCRATPTACLPTSTCACLQTQSIAGSSSCVQGGAGELTITLQAP